MSRKAVFLDRDGTINVERDYLRRPSELRLLPGSGRAIARLNRAGYLVVVLTNQSALARGLLDEAGLDRIHELLRTRLARHGARLDAVYVCPHHPQARVARYRRDCPCRKPRKGLLRRALRDLDIDARRSFVVGDDTRDLALAQGEALRPILVRTGKGTLREAEARALLGSRLAVERNLEHAADRILRSARTEAR